MEVLKKIMDSYSITFLGTMDCKTSHLPVFVGRLRILLEEGIFCPPKTSITVNKSSLNVDGYTLAFDSDFRVYKNLLVVPIKDLCNGIVVYGFFELVDENCSKKILGNEPSQNYNLNI